MHKLGILSDSDELPFRYPNIWALERTTGPDRLVIAPEQRHIDLLLELARCWSAGYWVLYVLLVSRLGNDPGRYQCPTPLFLVELEAFLSLYRRFLESDGRHHFWIGSPSNDGTLVYDQHNVIYAYGPLEAYRDVLERNGLNEAPKVRFPRPHVHHYHVSNDAWEDRIMKHWEWLKSELRSNDEY